MAKLEALVRKYRADILSSYRLSCAALSAKVVARTPKESGSLQASWTPNIGDPIAININIPGDTRRHDIPGKTNALKLGDKFSLGNGQPYVMRIEYEGWSRHKAPAGMLGVSTVEWDSIVDKAVRGI